MHELVYDGASPFLCNVPVVTCRWGMRLAPFAPAITRCYLAVLSMEYDLSQKLDLEAVAIIATCS